MASAGRLAFSLVLVTLIQVGHGLNGQFFWHVTDFHLDVNYSTNGNPTKMCWRTNTINDMELSKYGNYKCDSPYTLVQESVKAMQRFSDKLEPDFILWTGDDKAHVSESNFNEDVVVDLIANLTTTLSEAFPNSPLVPVLGNHDYYPTHMMPPRKTDMYTRVSDLWSKWLGEDVILFRNGGYYSVDLPNKVKMIVLNTVFYYKKNSLINADRDDDPAGQFKWLESVLSQARSQGRKTYITSHVPPGVFERHICKGGFQWFHDKYNKRYISIVNDYHDVIIAQFFAHQHSDTFRIIYSPLGCPVSYILIAPSITPWNTTLAQVGPNNPGVRKIYYNQATGQISNYEQFYFDLNNTTNSWSLEYSARDSYQLDGDITPLALHRLASQLENSVNRTVFDRYYLYNTVSFQSPSECDAECQRYQYCAVSNVDFTAFEKCRSGAAGNASHASGIFVAVLCDIDNAIDGHRLFESLGDDIKIINDLLLCSERLKRKKKK
uniref:Uncharacterized protein n=1 Tax=Strigamia maritima TaxID=126957 RepID=T1ITT5_STRMM